MEVFTIFLYQTLFSYIFTTTLWCEISKKYSDCFIYIFSRLILMLFSLLVVFLIYDYVDSTNYILYFILYPIILYVNIKFIKMTKLKTGII